MNTEQKPVFKNINGCESFSAWNDQPIEILGVIANPNDNSLIDAEAMPQFHVKLLKTGETNTAYVDEVDEQFWSEEMKAVLKGQDDWFAGKHENPFTGNLATLFEYGQALAELKSN